ncbi:hypothetical protein RA29_16505 [Tateyamaria sp. ANG-S1]|nr:hypothetical protein RA29_16505 [Tateyamaria sp. ANG-S1]
MDTEDAQGATVTMEDIADYLLFECRLSRLSIDCCNRLDSLPDYGEVTGFTVDQFSNELIERYF